MLAAGPQAENIKNIQNILSHHYELASEKMSKGWPDIKTLKMFPKKCFNAFLCAHRRLCAGELCHEMSTDVAL